MEDNIKYYIFHHKMCLCEFSKRGNYCHLDWFGIMIKDLHIRRCKGKMAELEDPKLTSCHRHN